MALSWFSVQRRSFSFVLGSSVTLMAATVLGQIPNTAQTLAEVDSGPRVRLVGNTRPEVIPGNGAAEDLGAVEDSLALDHMQLLLRRSPKKQAALDAYLQALNDKSLGNYHRWLTPAEFGLRFGLAQSDVDQVRAWLRLHGLVVNAVYPSRTGMDFSGTAAQVREAFQTEIHAYDVAGQRHVANAGDPTIPARLAGVVAGIVSLHDFRPRSLLITKPVFTAGTGLGIPYPVTASDLATIYNLTPLFKAGFTGRGQTIAIVGDSDVHSAADWSTFRTAFGLTAYSTGSFKEVHPAPAKGANNCTDPGAVVGWDEEPILDAEYATAAAPGATVELAVCANTKSTNGEILALTNLINASGALPAVISISYGNCEAANGATANAALNAAYQQAAAEGISVFVAAGDGGSAFCDVGATVATHGMGVNAWASTPYNVAVGGTDFSDVYSHTQSSYWSSANTATGSSAKSYIPETPWNDSCANPLIAAWDGYKGATGTITFCLEDLLTMDSYQTTTAGSGGPSGCATGAPLLSFVVSGTCHGYAKPSWQTVAGNPKDGVRDLPDVALFAADGIWGHSFLYCNSNLNDEDGTECKSTNVAQWSRGGGTSFAAPILAGIQALVAQKWGRQGNPNPVYYRLAAAQFSSATLKRSCLATAGAASGSTCVFHDINQGGAAVNCEGLLDCDVNVLSTSSMAFAPAYNAAAGWDFASGLGSVNAYNLVMSAAW